MSSITIIPRSYASTTSSNLPNINIPPMRPAYLNPKPAPRTIPPTYQHLTQQVQRKPALYGAGQRKYNNFHKFQTGTTTTFNGYTNYNGSNNINLPPTPAPRQYLPPTPFYNNNNRYQQQQNYHYNRYNNYRRPNFYNNNNYNNNIKNLPSLLDINPFHLPSEHNTRSFHHAQQYHPNQQHHQHLPRPTSRTRFHILSQLPSQSRSRSRSPFRPPPIKPRRIYQQQQQNNNNKNNYRRPPVPVPNINNNNNNFKGIILSDSMCSRVRTYALKNNYINIELSYESGCDIVKMINWLNTPEGRGTVGDKQFLLFCLGTNDVGRYGVDVSLQRVSELIRFVRQSFPGIRTIGWLSLSPRWKPTRFVSAAQIGQMHNQFNEHLRFLSKKLDFDIVDARLGPLDMRVEDGLHPSTTTGRWKYEGAIREWFSNRAAAHFSSSLSFQHHHQQQRPTVPTPTILTSTPIPTYASVNPKQALDRLEDEIRVMKDKVAEAWRRETHTIGKNPILVEQFANRLEEELRNKINEVRAQDPIVEKALERFQKEQKKGERCLQKGGKLGLSEYKDVRQYFCEASSTRLIYIYIPTVFGNIAEKNINYLKTMKDCTSIHAVLFSLYHGDLNLSFKQHLEEYDENLNNVCMHLLDICSDKKDVHQQKIWLSPYPPNMKLSNVEEKILNKIIRHTNKITGENGFKTFNRNYIWDKTHDDLLIKGSHYFSPRGIRLITQLFAEIIGKKWHRTMPK
ncbi:unnamed protein product [Rotaria sp. Silwood2]|nr:unnamed protein product [Rotaria sp. Silwood2]